MSWQICERINEIMMKIPIPAHTDNWVVQTNLKGMNAGLDKTKEYEIGPRYGMGSFLDDIQLFIAEMEQQGYDPDKEIEEEKTEDEPAPDYAKEIEDCGDQIRHQYLSFSLANYPDKNELNIKKLVAQNRCFTA